MDAITAFELLRENGNCVVKLNDLKDSKNPLNHLVKKYNIKQGKIIKGNTPKENTVVVLEAYGVNFTDEMEQEIIELANSYKREKALKKIKTSSRRKRRVSWDYLK